MIDPLTRFGDSLGDFDPRWRLRAWAIFGVFLAAWIALRQLPMDTADRIALSDVIVYLLPMLLTLIVTFYASAVTLGRGGVEHRFWGLICIASAALLMGESYWTWYAWRVDARGPATNASIILVSHAVAITAFFGVIIAMTRLAEQSRMARVRFGLDLAVFIAALYPAVYWWVCRPLIALDGPRSFVKAEWAALYPVVGVAMIGCIVALMLGWKAYRARSWERLVATSLVVYASGLLASPLWVASLSEEPSAASWYVVMLGLGYFLMFMAAIYRITARQVGIVEPFRLPRIRTHWITVTWNIFLVSLMPIVGWSGLSVNGRTGDHVIVWSAVVIAVTLALRSAVAGVERLDNRERSITDPVSGAYNARRLGERLNGEVKEAMHSGRPLSLLAVDVDAFAHINAVGGRSDGDRILASVASRLSSLAGGRHSVYRFTGDEFVVVLPEYTLEEAERLARRSWLEVHRSVATVNGSPVSLSIGIAQFPDIADTADGLLTAAVDALRVASVSDDDPIGVFDAAKAEALGPKEREVLDRRRSRQESVHVLAVAVDARDPETENHSRNVSDLATTFAQYLGLPAERIRTIAMGSLVHDVGKICVADETLHRAGPLDESDWECVREHPVLGERMIAAAGLDTMLGIVRSHHEHWDGEGYPDGLVGDRIPKEARIVSICDAFEAMTSPRAYRGALSAREALSEIGRLAGRQFDPTLADAFVRMMTSALATPSAAQTSPPKVVGGVDSV